MSPPKKVREFVKYQNRKLHEIGNNCSYVTMEELDGVVSRGGKIKVIEDVSGDDITGFVMSRLIYDRARSNAHAFDTDELQALIVRAAAREQQAKDEYKKNYVKGA